MTMKSILQKDYEKYKDFKLNYDHLPRKAENVYRAMTLDLIHVYQVSDTISSQTNDCKNSTRKMILVI